VQRRRIELEVARRDTLVLDALVGGQAGDEALALLELDREPDVVREEDARRPAVDVSEGDGMKRLLAAALDPPLVAERGRAAVLT
jgi:hypothetical protein